MNYKQIATYFERNAKVSFIYSTVNAKAKQQTLASSDRNSGMSD